MRRECVCIYLAPSCAPANGVPCSFQFCRARLSFASAVQPLGRCTCLLVLMCLWMLAERSGSGDNWARCLPSEKGCDEVVSDAMESAGEGSSNQLLQEEHAAVLAKAAQDSAGFLVEMLKESEVTPTY